MFTNLLQIPTMPPALKLRSSLVYGASSQTSANFVSACKWGRNATSLLRLLLHINEVVLFSMLQISSLSTSFSQKADHVGMMLRRCCGQGRTPIRIKLVHSGPANQQSPHDFHVAFLSCMEDSLDMKCIQFTRLQKMG